VGYFLDRRNQPERTPMALQLSFSQGRILGSGNDAVGDFAIHGSYLISDGSCRWVKFYTNHSVTYLGYNEGKGIWGNWSIRLSDCQADGGFHIWPEAMSDPSQIQTAAAADSELPVDEMIAGSKTSDTIVTV
jgi:hypothetical protein